MNYPLPSTDIKQLYSSFLEIASSFSPVLRLEIEQLFKKLTVTQNIDSVQDANTLTILLIRLSEQISVGEDLPDVEAAKELPKTGKATDLDYYLHIRLLNEIKAFLSMHEYGNTVSSSKDNSVTR